MLSALYFVLFPLSLADSLSLENLHQLYTRLIVGFANTFAATFSLSVLFLEKNGLTFHAQGYETLQLEELGCFRCFSKLEIHQERTRYRAWCVEKDTHRKGAHTLGRSHTTGLHIFLMHFFFYVRAALTLNFDVK